MKENRTALAVDIGNSGTRLGLFDDERLVAKAKWPASPDVTHEIWLERFRSAAGTAGVAQAGLVSVVPHATASVLQALNSISTAPAILIASGSVNRVDPVKLDLETPETVGPDRIANACAAIRLYGCPIQVLDAGTATTLCNINEDGILNGGVICPGPTAFFQALRGKTAALPDVAEKRCDDFFGGNTAMSLQSGHYRGYLEMLKGLIVCAGAASGSTTRVPLVGTGGGLNLFLDGIADHLSHYDPDLTLKGVIFAVKGETRS